VEVVFDGGVHVHHGFLALEPADTFPSTSGFAREATGGQANGLVGAQLPGALTMVTGLHTGEVPVRIERHDERPDLTAAWEDVVEVSLTVADAVYAVTAFDVALPVGRIAPGEYRARWCASGMDAGHDLDTAAPGEAPDRYLLQLWPQAPAPDEVLRVMSAHAASWHGVVAGTQPPDLDELRARGWGLPDGEGVVPADAEESWQVVPDVPLDDTDDDGDGDEDMVAPAFLSAGSDGEPADADRPPNPTLEEWGVATAPLAWLDRDLLDELTTLSPRVLRALAVRAARTLAERAGGGDSPVVVDALDVVARGGTLPPAWDDYDTARAFFPADEPGERAMVAVWVSGDDPLPHIPWEAGMAAVEAIRGAATAHDGRAATNALTALLSAAPDPTEAATEIRTTITHLTTR